jgi:pSer/pThr/pTyr-binding forkhead associated (FHA) protein
MPKLTYTLDGQEHTVEVTDSCSIGRDAGNTIALESEAGASRRHCQIIKLQSTFELADLKSTNGVRVNGQQVQRHKLRDGDRITIGETTLRWTDPATAADEDEISLEEPAAAGGGGGGGAAASDDCFLAYSGGSKDGQRLALAADRITFGRNKSNSVTLDDANVSTYHCEVTREGGAYIVRDLGSTNGTLVDGEPITEQALQHGARIRIGMTMLVFVDPTVSGFEEAMSAVDDLGSEWGMLRAEMDLDRVQRARRSQMVGIVGFVAVAGVAGWFVLQNPDMFREKAPELEVVEGNQMPDFSFEEIAGKWSPVAESPAEGSYESGDAQQGVSFYRVTRDGAGGRPAAVAWEDAFTVKPGAAYEFGAHVRASDGGAATMRIHWIGGGEENPHYSATDLVTDGGWTEVRRTAVPPAGTRNAVIELVNAGNEGAADFDDVVFKSGGSDDTQTLTDGDLRVEVHGDGAISIYRGSDPLVVEMGVVCGVLQQAALDTGRRPARIGGASVASVSKSDGGVKVSGKAYDPKSGTMQGFEVQVGTEGGQWVTLDLTLPEDAALVGVLSTEFVDAGVAALVWDEKFDRERAFRVSTTRLIEKLTRVSIGERKRFGFIVEEGKRARMALIDRGAQGFELGIGGAGPLQVRVNTDSASINASVEKVKSQAEDADRTQRYGKALELYGLLQITVPEGHPDYDTATTRIAFMNENGKQKLAALQTLHADAKKFAHDGDLTRTAEGAAALARQYEGHEIGDAAGKLGEQVQQDRAARDRVVAERMAAPILMKAQDFQKMNKKRLARAFYTDVATRFAGTDAAKTASEALAGLGKD